MDAPIEFERDDPLVEMMDIVFQGEPDILLLQLFTGMMKLQEETRKRENARLIAMEKRWATMKAAAEDKIVKILKAKGESSAKNPDSRKITTIVGTTFLRREREWKVELDEEMLLEGVNGHLCYTLTNQMGALLPTLIDFPEDVGGYIAEADATLKVTASLTQTAKDKLKALAILRAQPPNGEQVPWATVTPPGDHFSTRLKPGFGPHLVDAGHIQALAIEARRKDPKDSNDN